MDSPPVQEGDHHQEGGGHQARVILVIMSGFVGVCRVLNAEVGSQPNDLEKLTLNTHRLCGQTRNLASKMLLLALAV